MVGSWRCGCLVVWFCYQLIAKPGNKTGAPPWPDPSAQYAFFENKIDVVPVVRKICRMKAQRIHSTHHTDTTVTLCLVSHIMSHNIYSKTWWRHQMETFSPLLAICAGNSPIPGELPTQRPVTRSFDVFFDLRLNKRLSKQWWGWWFETLSRPLWRHHNEKRLCSKQFRRSQPNASFVVGGFIFSTS